MNRMNQSNAEFGRKIFGFSDIYREYFKGNVSDEQMTEHVSQPFWYSLRLSKKRLEKNGLTMEVDTRFVNDRKSPVSRLSYEKGEKVEAAIYKQEAVVSKNIKRDDKIIFKNKEKKLCFTGVIKAIGDGENAICPRCGHNGKISSYIDGCDYCQSKFQVSDFEEKISTFNTETDGKKKISGICKKIVAFFGIAMILTILAIIISFLVLLVTTATNGSALTLSYSALTFAMMFNIVPILKDIVFSFAIISVLLLIVIKFFTKNEKIVRNSVYYQIKDSMVNFSPNDFLQNIEYKLRNIHFAENATEVEAFASFNLEKVISNYENVIECFVHKIKFESFKKDENGYLMDVEVILRISRLINNKVKTENEKLFLNMSGKYDMEINNISSVMEFVCKNCGSGIDIIKGGKCDYCGEKMDYSKYDWIIDGYYSNISKDELNNPEEKILFGKKKYIEYYKKLRVQLVILFVAGLLVTTVGALVKNKEILHMIKYQAGYNEQFDKEFKRIPKLEDMIVGSQLEKIEEESWVFNKEAKYEFDGDFDAVSEKYIEEICNERGYKLLISDGKCFGVYKGNEFDDNIYGYFGLYVEFDNGKISLDFSAYDTVEDFKESIEDGVFD